MPGELPESGNRRPISRPKMEHFLNDFISENQFLFHESKLFYHGIQCSKNISPHPRWEVCQIMKIALF